MSISADRHDVDAHARSPETVVMHASGGTRTIPLLPM
jgi:hypothetical protein